MFDKVIIKGRIDTADIDTIVLRNYLEQCTKGDELYYTSTAYANFEGCFITLNGDIIKCKCSINKLWQKSRTGKLDNSRPMTFRNAVKTINELLMRLSLKPENTVVTYYEVGLTMKMSQQATEYISRVEEVGGKVLWNDANFPENRQKTTERSKHYRKILKIYDKTFEAAEKGRFVGSNVLRIESIYRHQSIPLLELIEESNLRKLARIFYNDWSSIRFVRELSATSGIRLGQLEKAKEIHRLGVDRYKEKYKDLFMEKKITKKQWETIRNFARSWPEEKTRYIEEVTAYESEFRGILVDGFQIGSINYQKGRNITN